MIRDPKTFCFNFNWPKDVDENLKHEIEFIIESNESLLKNKIKQDRTIIVKNISTETIFTNTENNETNE